MSQNKKGSFKKRSSSVKNNRQPKDNDSRIINKALSKKGLEYTLTAQKTIFPNCILLTVFNPDESYLGEAIITLAQWENPNAMDLLIRDMNTMVAKGISMALIITDEGKGKLC